MATPGPNLFHRLHKWAHRQDENFLTEALAVVLEQLLTLAPAVGTRLIANLTGGFISVAPDDASAVELHTQVEAVSGRPDLEVRTPERLVWVEVKAESELRRGQLEGYRELLKQSNVAQTRLVLLTRYPQLFGAGDETADVQLRWFEIADWFENEQAAADEAGDVPGFLVKQFRSFLEARGMKLAQVGKFMPEGLRAFTNLMNMLVEAALACRVTVKKSANWEHMGVYLDGRRYWVGITLEEPEKLWFMTCGQIDKTAASKLPIGELCNEGSWVPGEWSWEVGAELDSEAIHFFARTKVGQMEWLTAFLRDCLAKARSVETPNQPPLTNNADEDS